MLIYADEKTCVDIHSESLHSRYVDDIVQMLERAIMLYDQWRQLRSRFPATEINNEHVHGLQLCCKYVLNTWQQLVGKYVRMVPPLPLEQRKSRLKEVAKFMRLYLSNNLVSDAK